MSDKILRIELGPMACLNVVRGQDGLVSFVIAETSGLRRRTSVEVCRGDAMKIAKFIAGIGDLK